MSRLLAKGVSWCEPDCIVLRYGGELPDLDTSIEVGRRVFWANTVPYKPIGNKAWSVRVKRRFVPYIRELLWNIGRK